MVSPTDEEGGKRVDVKNKSWVERRRQAVGPGRRTRGPGRLVMGGRRSSLEETRFISSPGLKDVKKTLT